MATDPDLLEAACAKAQSDDESDQTYMPNLKQLDRARTTTKKTKGAAKNKKENKAPENKQKRNKKVYGEHLLFGSTDPFFRDIAPCPPACAQVVNILFDKCSGQPNDLKPKMIYDAVHEWIIAKNIKYTSALTSLSALFTFLQKICLFSERIANSNLKSRIKKDIRKFAQTSEENPMLEVKFLRNFTEENSILAAAVGLLVITGIRSNELLQLIWDENLYITSYEKMALIFAKAKIKDDKGSKLANKPPIKFIIVPIKHGDKELITMSWLLKFLIYDPPANAKLTNYLKQAYYKLNLPIPRKLGTHCCRRTSVNLLKAYKASSQKISQFIQWSGPETIKIYEKDNYGIFKDANLQIIKKPLLLGFNLKNEFHSTRHYVHKKVGEGGKCAILAKRLRSKALAIRG